MPREHAIYHRIGALRHRIWRSGWFQSFHTGWFDHITRVIWFAQTTRGDHAHNILRSDELLSFWAPKKALFLKILKQILKNVIIKIPNDMWFERKVINTCVNKKKIKHRIHEGMWQILNLKGFRYDISFIDPHLGGFGEIPRARSINDKDLVRERRDSLCIIENTALLTFRKLFKPFAKSAALWLKVLMNKLWRNCERVEFSTIVYTVRHLIIKDNW